MKANAFLPATDRQTDTDNVQKLISSCHTSSMANTHLSKFCINPNNSEGNQLQSSPHVKCIQGFINCQQIEYTEDIRCTLLGVM